MRTKKLGVNLWSLFGMVLLVCLPSQSSGQLPGMAAGKQVVNIDELAPGPHVEGKSEVSIEVNPLNQKHLVVMANPEGGSVAATHHFLYYSVDGGIAWDHVDYGDLYNIGGTNLFDTNVVNNWFDPSITFDDQGVLYAAIGNQTYAVVCRFENGAFLSKPVLPSRCTRIAARDKWLVGAGPAPGNPGAQNIYFAESGWSGIEVSYSTDGGATFTASLSNPLGQGSFPRPVVGNNGVVYVAWYGSFGDIMFARSTDGGRTFSTAVTAIHTAYIWRHIRPPAQPTRGITGAPVIDVDRSGGPDEGNLYIAYVDPGTHGGNDYDIFVIRSEDGGQTWGHRVRVNNDSGSATQFNPWLDVDRKTGMVGVAWYDTRDDPVNNAKVKAYFAASVDGGWTFGPNFPLANFQSDESGANTVAEDYGEYLGLVLDSRLARVVWADNYMTFPGRGGWFTSNPVPGATLTLNGATWTFVTGPPADHQTQIGATKSETLARLVQDLNASTDVRIQEASYSSDSVDVFTVQAKTRGPQGETFTVAANAPGGCSNSSTCFINTFGDNITYHLSPTLNLKANIVSVLSDLLVIGHGPSNELTFERAILQYDGKAGAFDQYFAGACYAVDLKYGPDGRLYILDTISRRFGICDAPNAVRRVKGKTGEEDIDDPNAIFVGFHPLLGDRRSFDFGPDGNLYISNGTGVLLFQGPFGPSPGAFIMEFVSGLADAGKIRFGPDGALYIADERMNRVLRYAGPFNPGAGDFIDNFVETGSGGLSAPIDLVFGPDLNLYVASSGTGEVLRYAGPYGNEPKKFLGVFAQLGFVPGGIAFGPDNDLFASGTPFIAGFPRGVFRYDGNTGSSKGQFAHVETEGRGVGPLLFSSIPLPALDLGDFTGTNRCVDRSDMNDILAAIKSRSSDPKYDLNGDGQPTIADARKLVLLFTNPQGVPCP